VGAKTQFPCRFALLPWGTKEDFPNRPLAENPPSPWKKSVLRLPKAEMLGDLVNAVVANHGILFQWLSFPVTLIWIRWGDNQWVPFVYPTDG
jgi:hypothetical protein